MTEPGADLILKMAAGDRAASCDFYDRYAPLVYPLILRLVRDPGEAADVLQDVFWEAWQAAADYDPARGTAEAWIVVRARSRAIDRVRSVRARSTMLAASLDEGVAPAADAGADAARRAADRETVPGALAALPQAQREVIALAYWDGLTQAEIAERLKQPLDTVKTRMRLGLEHLREIVEGRAG